jgi:hypothetical protein
MIGNLSSFITQIVSLINTSVLAKVIFIIVLLLIALIVVVPILLKLRRKRLKTKETQSLVRDLMVWRHVAQLAQGGEDQVKAKKDLSDNIAKIKGLLEQGFDLASTNYKGLYKVPWFMLLGEPYSGKSSLLKESELDMIPSEVEHGADAETKSLPVRMWLGGKAVVCDVSGSVFFDRWLGGSSAEWSYIVSEFCKKHYRMPLNGVILTIPADALLSDDSDLTRKKAILMANELARLLNYSGMRLPCSVVVTKLDTVEGFREYVSGLSGDLRCQILGFDNDGAVYDKGKFKGLWDALVERFRSGYKKSMMTRDIFSRVDNDSNRTDLTAKMFLFPENFAAMYDNLNIYLDTLFSDDNFHGTKETVFDGLFFTSATDTGISFSPAIAAMAGKSTGDFQIVGKKPVSPQPYFIRNTLQNFIFNPSLHAGFVRKKALTRSIPAIAMCAVFLFFGFLFFITAVAKYDDLKMTLTPIVNYYNSLNSFMRDGSAGKAPVIIKNDGGQGYTLDNQPSAILNGVSPIQFYTNALSYCDIKLIPSAGFVLSSILVFLEPDMGLRDRRFITNTLYGPFVRIPMIRSVGDKLLEDVNVPPVLTLSLRSVIQSFVLLDGGSHYDYYKRLIASKQFSAGDMIDYILPGIPNVSRALLTRNTLAKDASHSFAADMDYIYSNDFFQAKTAALGIMISDWQSFSVYPGTLYGNLKGLVNISQGIIANASRLNFLLNTVNNVSTQREVRNLVSDWNNLMQENTGLVSNGEKNFQAIINTMAKMRIPLGIASSGALADPFGNNLINDFIFNDLLVRHAVDEFTRLFHNDMDFIGKNSGISSGSMLLSVSDLQNNFPANLAKEVDNLRTSAQSLKSNALFSDKLTADVNSPSVFSTYRKILTLANAIDIPDPNTVSANSGTDWMDGRYDLVNAFTNFEDFVKPIADNDKVSRTINNARIMLAAEAYLNRYVVLNTQYDFLSTSPEVINETISARAGDDGKNIFSFSGRAIQNALGAMPFNSGYDPVIVKNLIDSISTYEGLFSQNINLKVMPRFLQNQDKSIYQTDAFSAYLERYIDYWANYPDTAYVPVSNWSEYKARVNQNKPYQINSVLQSLYTECIDILNNLNDIALTGILKEQKTSSIAMLNDKIKLLSALMSVDADRMLTAWNRLPSDPDQAFRYLRSITPDEIRTTYMTVYSDTRNINIGWWNAFIMDGFTVLSKMFCRQRLAEFSSRADGFRRFPVLTDGSKSNPVTSDTLSVLAALLYDMGAGKLPLQPSDGSDPVASILHPVLFKDAATRNWAQTVYQFASAAADTVEPLTWTLVQPPIDVQGRLSTSGRLLAVNRFRYMEVSTVGQGKHSFNTYMNEEQTLATGKAADRGIDLKFYRSSADTRPQAEVNLTYQWSVFDLYLSRNVITTADGTFFPVFMSDELGQYAYYIAIKFNHDIPSPDKWYSSLAWPAFIVSDSGVTASPPASAYGDFQ